MTPEETGKLHFVTTTESLASQKVTLFRIFDPSTLNGTAEDQTYKDLDGHTSSLRFEGRFAQNKTVTEIRDMRSGE